jgi:cobaltochelatase CobT
MTLPENPAEPFKKALAEATKAIANAPELTVAYSVDFPLHTKTGTE